MSEEKMIPLRLVYQAACDAARHCAAHGQPVTVADFLAFLHEGIRLDGEITFFD